jgi:hypothetical protein
MNIPIDIEGLILNSTRIRHSVRVVDDRANTGGFLVFEWWSGSVGPNDNGAFDAWVENETALEQYFTESKWSVEWKQQ